MFRSDSRWSTLCTLVCLVTLWGCPASPPAGGGRSGDGGADTGGTDPKNRDAGHHDAGHQESSAVDAGVQTEDVDDAGTPRVTDGGAWPTADAGASPPSGLAPPAGGFTLDATDALTYRLYIPPTDRWSGPLPLVMMLHGCMQDSLSFADATQMNAYADQLGFVVVWPEQSLWANGQRCWNWYLPLHQSRGLGEPAALADVVAAVQDAVEIDASRIYVAGLSAGASMSAILGVTYPDIFRRIGMVAGLSYRAAATPAGALLAMSGGGAAAEITGPAAYEAMGEAARVVPVWVLHGRDDDVVNPVNADLVIAQWAYTNDLADDSNANQSVVAQAHDEVQAQAPDQTSYTTSTYVNAAGAPLMVSVKVDSLAHAWPGGTAGMAYTTSAGPSASALLWDFFSSTDIED